MENIQPAFISTSSYFEVEKLHPGTYISPVIFVKNKSHPPGSNEETCFLLSLVSWLLLSCDRTVDPHYYNQNMILLSRVAFTSPFCFVTVYIRQSSELNFLYAWVRGCRVAEANFENSLRLVPTWSAGFSTQMPFGFFLFSLILQSSLGSVYWLVTFSNFA